MTSIWFRGVCDEVLELIQAWRDNYTRGEPSAEGEYLTKAGEVLKIPTMFAHRIGFRKAQLEHLVRILREQGADPVLVEDFEAVYNRFERTTIGPDGQRYFLLNFPYNAVVDTVKALEAAKSGATGKPPSKLDWIKNAAVSHPGPNGPAKD